MTTPYDQLLAHASKLQKAQQAQQAAAKAVAAEIAAQQPSGGQAQQQSPG